MVGQHHIDLDRFGLASTLAQAKTDHRDEGTDPGLQRGSRPRDSSNFSSLSLRGKSGKEGESLPEHRALQSGDVEGQAA